MSAYKLPSEENGDTLHWTQMADGHLGPGSNVKFDDQLDMYI